MEQTDHTFAAAQQKNRRKKRIRTLSVLVAVVVVLAVAAATFTAPADAVVEEVLYRAGGYTMSVSVDELDIGGIGIASSALGLSIFSAIAGTAIAIEWRAAIAAVLFSVAIGVLFGSYPAAKASRMPPIDALQRR